MNQNELFYQMIFKRKSFHLFRDTGNEQITQKELDAIQATYQSLTALVPDIRTAIRIVPAEETTCNRGQEYCILLYSKKADNYLQNIGYLGGLLDLYLASLNIGTLWFGFGKTDCVKYNDLDFVIMIAIKKVLSEKFRKDMFKSKRKPLTDIWEGTPYQAIGNIVRFTPSSCNTQPWKVISSEDKLEVYRYKEPGKHGMMPAHRVTYSNRIDIGIFLLFLELCLQHDNISYERTLNSDSIEGDETMMNLVATYNLA